MDQYTSDRMCSMAERTTVGQDFGSVIGNAEFDMLTPGMMESSITVGQSVFYGNFAVW